MHEDEQFYTDRKLFINITINIMETCILFHHSFPQCIMKRYLLIINIITKLKIVESNFYSYPIIILILWLSMNIYSEYTFTEITIPNTLPRFSAKYTATNQIPRALIILTGFALFLHFFGKPVIMPASIYYHSPVIFQLTESI